MTISYPLLPNAVNVTENLVIVFVVENVYERRRLLSSLVSEQNGEPGDVILSKNYAILDFAKYADVVTDPLTLKFDSKKIVNKINQLAIDASNNYYPQIQKLLSEINSVASNICIDLDIETSFTEVEDFSNIIKILNYKVDNETTPFVEQIFEYVKIQSKLLGKELIFFYNLKSLLDENEIDQLYKQIFYDKMNIVLIEDSIRNEKKECEELIIIDNDLCII